MNLRLSLSALSGDFFVYEPYLSVRRVRILELYGHYGLRSGSARSVCR